MNCVSNPSKLSSFTWREAAVAFPVVGGGATGLNQVHVIAYGDSLDRVTSVPQTQHRAAKLSLEQARFGEHQPWVNIDVTVHFANADFDGISFGLALALADKRARYGFVGRAGRLVATGVVGPQGVVEAVEAFAVKLACMEQVLTAGDLFVYPARNVVATAGALSEALQRLHNRGIVLRAVTHVEQLRDLWNHNPQSYGGKNMVEQIGLITETKAFEQLGLLVLDGSPSMDDPGLTKQPKAEEVNQAVRGLISRLQNSQKRDNFYLAVVTYAAKVKHDRLVPTPITQVDDTADYNPRRDHGEGTAIGDALAAAHDVAEGFLAGQTTVSRSVVIIVMSDGQNNCGQDPIGVAERIEQSGKRITLCAVGYGKGDGLDEGTLKRLVSEPQCYKYTLNTKDLRDFFEASISQVRG